MQKVFLIDGINFSDPMDFAKNSLKSAFREACLEGMKFALLIQISNKMY
jgi:hypothetical protein